MPQYQGVWTLEQQAQAQSNQQWVTDPNFKNTTLLLQADGTGSGSQNQTFLDGSTNNFFITRNGNTTQGSFSPFSQAPGYWGNYFNGTTAYLSLAASTDWQWPSTSWTVEMWVYNITNTNYTGRTAPIQIQNGSATADINDWSFGTDGNGKASFYYWIGSGPESVTGSTTIPLNTWTHVAATYDGTSVIKIYVNGVLDATGTKTGTPITSTKNLIIGAGNGAYYNGYISNLRRVVGSVVYTSNFTPSTTPLTNITNTQILTCQSNRFIDNSVNAYPLTIGGTPSVQAFGPFAPALQWTPDVVGGSGYFDGSGDYLTAASNAAFAFGTGDYTVEAWVYLTAVSTTLQVVFGSGSISTNNFYFTIDIDQISVGTTLAFISNQATSFTTGQWFHIAACRSGTTLRLYRNGAQVGSNATDNTNWLSDGTTVVGIGADLATQFVNGYMSGLRVLKGTALYTGSTYTIPTAPFTAITNTSLLLNYTNAGIYDGKMANNLETVGNAQVATSPVKYGSGSMYFPGATTDYLLIPDKDLLTFGTASFTVEAWVFPTLIAGDERPIWSHGTNSSNWMSLYITSSGYVEFAAVVSSSSIVDVTTPVTVPLSTWTHIALVRNNNIFKIYINGIDVGSSSSPTTTSSAIGSYSDSFRVGGPRWSGASDAFQGFIDDLRITLAARYFTTFTPPQQALPRQ